MLFCDYAIDIKAKGFGEVSHSELTSLPDLVEFLHVRYPCYLEPKKKRDVEGKFVDVETMTNMLTEAIDQFEQMLIAVEQWRQTLAEGTSGLAFVDSEVKIHFEKHAQIDKIAVGQFGAWAVEGCAPTKGTKLDLTTI